jgi:lactoylglutathione lyase
MKLKSMKLYLYSDGGARGNPGPSAVAFVATNETGVVLKTGSRYIGNHTNNQAEYHALHMALEYAIEVRVQEVICHLDSELVVKQLTGRYSIKNAELQRLSDQIKVLLKSFGKVSFVNVPREHPKIGMADALVNKTLDEEAAKQSHRKPLAGLAPPKNVVPQLGVHVSIRVSNMQRSIGFYEKYFDLKVARRVELKDADKELAFLENPAGDCILELTHYHKQAQFTQARFADRLFDHLGFDVADIYKTVAAMIADGIRVVEEPYEFNEQTTIAFVDDPDGTRIELVQRH